MILRRTVAFAVLALFGGACGGGSTGQRALAPPRSGSPSTPVVDVSAASPAAGGAQEADRNEIPDAVVRDVANGAEINIRSLAPAPEPLFFWFYAPH